MILEQSSYTDFQKHYGSQKRVFVHRMLMSDTLTPINIVTALKDHMQEGALLESGLKQDDSGRYSFIGFDVMAALSVEQGRAVIKIDQQERTQATTDPLQLLRDLITKLQCVGDEAVMPFVSSAIGFIAYEAVRYFSELGPYQTHTQANHDAVALPEMQLNFYRTTLVFDHQEQTCLLGCFVDCSGQPATEYREALKHLNRITETINADHAHNMSTTERQANTTHDLAGNIQTDLSDAEFIELVERAKTYVAQGDAFQIVISRTFSLPYHIDPLQIYRAIRKVTPAPFMFYLPQKNCVIVGASPERLISVYDGYVTINPIAGTRKRDATRNDLQIENDLLNDPKEIAEHMMLVDLARNDIGAVSEPGSIQIKALKKVKHYSHVSHITSLVSGKLHTDYDAFDALKAAFPAGTLSGAPKIRVMQIISELEKNRRGIYGGVICRLDYNGNLDTCIAIRTAVLANGIAKVRAGGGIVFDSDPKLEANETRSKARGLLTAITLANRGLS